MAPKAKQTTSKKSTLTPMSSQSTRSHPQKKLNWLFFNPVNESSEVFPMTVDGYGLDQSLCDLEWAAHLKRRFKFRAEKVRFWEVGYWPISSFPLISDDSFSPKLFYR